MTDRPSFATNANKGILTQIRAWRQRGLSLRRTASELNPAGLRTRSGAEWRHEYVANLLRAESSVM